MRCRPRAVSENESQLVPSHFRNRPLYDLGMTSNLSSAGFTGKKTGEQIGCLLRWAQRTRLAESTFDHDLVAPFRLLSNLAIVEGYLILDSTFHLSHGVTERKGSSSEEPPSEQLSLLRALPVRTTRDSDDRKVHETSSLRCRHHHCG